MIKSGRLLLIVALLSSPENRLWSAPYEFAFGGRVQVTGGGGGGGGGGTGDKMGINLAGHSYWSNSLPFWDGMKFAENWYTNTPTNQFHLVPQDAEGHPLEIPYNIPGVGPVTVSTLIYRDIRNGYPSGLYVMSYEGDGDINLRFDATVTRRSPGRIEVTVNAGQGDGIEISITRSNPANHVRNMRFIEARYETNPPPTIFNPSFLDDLRGFHVLRFMDWGNTNDGHVQTWSQRTKPNQFDQAAPEGVALEIMIDLANELDANPWFCVPYKADDNFIREMARLIRSRLKPNLKVYIEYGNEVWNTVFSIWQYSGEKGCAEDLNLIQPFPGNCSDRGIFNAAAIKYQARRSGKIFQIFEQELGSRPLVKVAGAQAQGVGLCDLVLTLIEDPAINPTGVRASALAVAPYFGHSMSTDLVANGELYLTADQIIDRLVPLIRELGTFAVMTQAVADRHGVDHITYEGGQHLVGYGENANNEILTAKLQEVNRHPRMYDLYQQMFGEWDGAGGGLFTAFNSVQKYSKWGSWGYKETQSQPASQAPKYRAIKDRLSQP